ncbi:MAG TPA: tripartite tricarboxylate transporter substrate binding protein [Burkholderiales bacterium]|nr:tripartite tricarboxylate transporter substrate binding protein [Burkholderiales bacterium]
MAHACALLAAVGLYIFATLSVHAQDKRPAGAEDYPSKPIRLIIASPPGGGIDIIGRLVAQKLTESWSQTVIPDNRPGGANTLGTALVAKAPPDGYTLLVQSLGIAYAGELRKLPFDAARDLVPIVPVATQPSMLGVYASVPAKSVREFLQLARSKPGQLTYGSAGPGGASHMATELLSSMAGIKLVTVQYKGIGPAMTGILSGEVDLGVLGISTMLPHVKNAKIRALGVTGAKRSTLAPDVPTIAEAGVPRYEFEAWYALFAPTKTPHAVIVKINHEVNRALQQSDTRQRLAGIGMDPLGGSEEAFSKYFQLEVAKWAKVIRDAKISGE